MNTLFPLSSRCKVTLEINGNLLFISPYDANLVAQLKAQIPPTDRAWQKDQKAWLVTPQYAGVLVKLVHAIYGEDLDIPAITAIKPVSTTKLLDVRYIGQCKSRDDGSVSAFGYANSTWSVIFPEESLRAWFEAGPATPNQPSTLYGILGIGQAAGADDIKNAFRRLARQWHPDVCKDLDAGEQFKKINHAYQILNDNKTRTRYDAGLQFEKTLTAGYHTEQVSHMWAEGYRSPLRCGYILCNGVDKMSRVLVEKILAWEDITSGDKTLVVSWPMGAKEPLEVWL